MVSSNTAEMRNEQVYENLVSKSSGTPILNY
jgi:hypothetical protein